MPAYELTNVIVLSTAHITLVDGERMTRLHRSGDWFDTEAAEETGPFRGAFTEGGWFCTYSQCDDSDDTSGRVYEGGWTTELVNVLKWARENGLDYVLFDRDGPEIEELPKFEW